MDVPEFYLGDVRGESQYASESSSSISEDSTSDTPTRVPVRRKWPKRGRYYIPRILKNDVRRHYGTMITNVFNTNNQEFVKSFFKCYGIPSFRMILPPLDPAAFTHLPPQLVQSTITPLIEGVSLEGDEWLHFHGMFTQVLSPDQVFRLTDARLVTRVRDRCSILIMSTEMEFTRIYDVNPLDVMNSAFSFDRTATETATPSPPPNKRHFPSVRDDLVFHPKFRGEMKSSAEMTRERVAPASSKPVGPMPLKLLPKPRHYIIKSRMIIMIDAHRRIESLTFGDGKLPQDFMDALERKAQTYQHIVSTISP